MKPHLFPRSAKMRKFILRNFRVLALPVFIAVLFVACHKKSSAPSENNNAELPENVISLEEGQIQMAGIKTGKIEKKVISELIECTGSIEVPPNNYVSVSVPMGGYVKKTFYYTGNYVQKGAVLVILEHPDYTQVQQKFLEAASALEYYREDLKRQGELTIEDAASIKKLQKAKADFQTAEANFLSLKSQLGFLGIKTDSLTAESISSQIYLRSPISGYVTEINANPGNFVDSKDILYKLVDNTHLHLELKIFEKDIHKIKEGQKIEFSSLYNKAVKNSAYVHAVGKLVDEQNRTVNIHGHIEGPNTNFIPGMFIHARIFLNSDSVYVVPSEAIVRSGKENALFLKHEGNFEKIIVKTGSVQDNYTQVSISDPNILKGEIVISGAYYLNAELEAEE
ncbi:MAG: efflux RND transporter periplasmic adaptor subunit [Bacteroidales bacterium]|nr:efflux RND transporter periplasmic adaptor subunit [Bacteroidales bacterium]